MKRFIKYEVNKKVISFGFIEDYLYEINDFINLEKSFDNEDDVHLHILNFEKTNSALLENPFINYVHSAYFVRKIEYLDIEDNFDIFSRVLSEDWIFAGNKDIEVNEKMIAIEDEAFNEIVY